jgi:hypothetical protein
MKNVKYGKEIFKHKAALTHIVVVRPIRRNIKDLDDSSTL